MKNVDFYQTSFFRTFFLYPCSHSQPRQRLWKETDATRENTPHSQTLLIFSYKNLQKETFILDTIITKDMVLRLQWQSHNHGHSLSDCQPVFVHSLHIYLCLFSCNQLWLSSCFFTIMCNYKVSPLSMTTLLPSDMVRQHFVWTTLLRVWFPDTLLRHQEALL